MTAWSFVVASSKLTFLLKRNQNQCKIVFNEGEFPNICLNHARLAE